VNVGPQTTEIQWCILTHLNGFFSGDYNSALKGRCPFKFLHVFEIDPGYVAHPPSGTGVPQKNFNGENLKFGLKFRMCAPITSGPVGVSSRNFFQTTRREVGVIMWVQLLEGLPPKFWEGQKTVQISARFLTTFDFDCEYLRKGSKYRKSEKNSFNHNHFHVGRKKLGELWSKKQQRSSGAYWPTQMDFFPETNIFLPLRGAAPSNFYTCYRLTHANQRTPHRGRGSSIKILKAKT